MPSPSQPQVVDEVWDDRRIQSFLERQPFGDQSADFYVLLKAYQGMRVNDFQRFIDFFVEAGRDVNARDGKGRTLLEIISKHRNAGGFVEVLENCTAARR
jgi:hypothetical protein|tara:strand:- start:64 stop:363 length:300 start_codon:yes stop_codon:yes gene_type:complete